MFISHPTFAFSYAIVYIYLFCFILSYHMHTLRTPELKQPVSATQQLRIKCLGQ